MTVTQTDESRESNERGLNPNPICTELDSEEPSENGGIKIDFNEEIDVRRVEQRLNVPDQHQAKIICISSLLHQFTNVKVRGDFLNGFFGPNINPDLLQLIDEIRGVLLPRWQAGGIPVNLPRSQQALAHFGKILARTPEFFITSSSSDRKMMTYEEWMSTLELLASDRYWQRVEPTDRCTHIAKEEFQELNKPVKVTKVELKKSESRSKTKSSRGVKTCKVEEIILSSDSSDTSDSCSTQDDSQSSSSSSTCSSKSQSRSRRRHRKRHQADKRSVVTPPIFQMDGKTSLEDYLSTFDYYFEKKFMGNSYDKTQMLSKFLSGELLKVYEARGGRRMKYRKMKDELIKYYKEKKIGSRKYWRKQLDNASLENDETYDLFSMRLVELANLAYPKDKKDCALELRKSFLKSVAPYILTKIKDAERASKAVSGSRKHLPFNSIVKIATELQSQGVKPKTVMWASNAVEPKPKSNENQFSPPSYRTFSRQNDRREQQHKPGDKYRSHQSDVNCSFCKRRGHTKSECWRAASLCLICGGDHFIEKCPKYDVNHRSRSRGRQNQPLN